MTEKEEIERYLTFILNKLGENYPLLAKQLTGRASSLRNTVNKFEKKEYKIKLLIKEHRAVFNELASELNKAYPTQKGGGFSLLMIYFNYSEEGRLPGSYGSKYGFGQGPVDD